MILSEYIFNGRIGNLRTGLDIRVIDKKIKLENLQEEEGDIPALYQIIVDRYYFLISVYNNIIIGIEFDFEYDIKRRYKIKYEEFNLTIGFDTIYEDFVKYLILSDVKYKSIFIDENNTQILIIKSNIVLRFYKYSTNKTLFKAQIFDSNLYDHLILITKKI